MGKSKRRLEMGEEKWELYQKRRNCNKTMANKKRNAEKVINARRNNKLKLIAYKGGKCEKCGYNKNCPPAYDFHHKDPKAKEFGITKKLTGNFEKLKKEVDKCQLLCKNCHAEEHDALYEKRALKAIKDLLNFNV